METDNSPLESLNEQLHDWISFYGAKSPAWNALRISLMDGLDATSCLDAFLRVERSTTAITLERVLTVITKYTMLREELFSSDKRIKSSGEPVWINRNGILPDGYEISQLWGEIRAICHSNLSISMKKEKIDAMKQIMRWYIGQAPRSVRERLRETLSEMKIYTDNHLTKNQ